MCEVPMYDPLVVLGAGRGTLVNVLPLSSQNGTYKIVKARFGPWLEPCFRQTSLKPSSCSVLFARQRLHQPVAMLWQADF